MLATLMFINLKFNDFFKFFQLLMIKNKKFFYFDDNIIDFSNFKSFISNLVINCI